MHELADSTRDDSEHDREGEASVKCREHDIHANDTELLLDEDQNDDEKEDGSANDWMRGPTPVTKLEARII